PGARGPGGADGAARTSPTTRTSRSSRRRRTGGGAPATRRGAAGRGRRRGGGGVDHAGLWAGTEWGADSGGRAVPVGHACRRGWRGGGDHPAERDRHEADSPAVLRAAE